MNPSATLFAITLMVLFILSMVNGESSSAMNDPYDEQALHELLSKTRGWLKIPQRLSAAAFSSSSSSVLNLQIDFKVHSRSPHILNQKNHKLVPLYKGRAIVSQDLDLSTIKKGSDEKRNNRVRLVAVSSLLQQSIQYDSDKSAYTQTLYSSGDDKQSTTTTTPTSITHPISFPFHTLIDSILDSEDSSSHYIPNSVPIYDEAASRLCPTEFMQRHVVYFADQHYIFCVLKQDNKKEEEQASSSSNLLLLRYIIGQEFTVEIQPIMPALNMMTTNGNKKVRGLVSQPNQQVNQEDSEFESLFASSSLIQEEFELLKRKSSISSNKLTLKNMFPMEVARFSSSANTSNKVVSSAFSKIISPAKAYFLSSKSAVCTLKWLRDTKTCTMDRESAEIIPESEKKVCVFLHGAGQWPEDKGEPVNDFQDYWGPMSYYTPQCSERWFIREETKLRGWDNADLQKSFCDILLMKHLPDKTSTDNVVKNTIIFAHSMGNLILGAAIKNGVCSLEKETVSWYNVMGPVKGSKAAIVLKDICSNKISITNPSFTKIIASKGGYCLSTQSSNVYPTYDTLQPNYLGLKEVEEISKAYVKGQMCGVSPYGLNTMMSAPLEFLSMLVGYGEPNDGLVPYSSCIAGSNGQFTENYKDQFYSVTANHADGTCRSGDAWFGSSKPCSFFINKV